MKLQKLVAGLGLVAGTVVALSTAPAQAASFTAQDAKEDGCIGKVTCEVNDFFTLTGSNKIAFKSVPNLDNTSGLGVQGGGNTEINLGEFLNVGFKKLSVLEELTLSFLYRPGVHADRVFEVALVTVNDIINGTLTVTGNTSAVFSTGATVFNLSPSSNTGGGVYSILNPFGNTAIKGFSLTAQSNVTGPRSVSVTQNSDFALSSVKVTAATAVPEPGTVGALLGVGAMTGLTQLRRRKGSAKA